MNWDDVRYFLAVVRTGSLSGAAKQLGVNHSTVARHIDSLEAVLQTRLFDRLPMGYQLTAAGHEITDHALLLETEALKLQRKLQGRDLKLAGPIRVATPELAVLDLSEPLKQFNQLYPDMDVHIFPSVSHADIEQLEVDVALRLTKTPPDDVVGKRITSMTFVAAANGQALDQWYKEGGSEAIPWIMNNAEEGRQWLATLAPGARLVMSSPSTDYIIAAVKQGVGAAILPRHRVETEEGLVVVSQPRFELTLDLWRLSHPDLRNNEKVRVFCQFMEQNLSQVV